MKLYKKGEQGRYTFVFPHTDKTGNEIVMRDPKEVPFPGGPYDVGMTMSINGLDRGAAVLHAGLMDPTWGDLDAISGRVNRAWRIGFIPDTNHTFFECASRYASTIWLWFGS